MSETSPIDELYGAAFHESLREGTERSASLIVPVLVDLLNPRSVVDVGCGSGLWLAAFLQQGVTDLVGIDGPWTTRSQCSVAGVQFIERNLSEPVTLDRTFDLALCLEVAEHLTIAAANRLIGELTCLSPVVVFSAAVPFQGGEGHVSERWPTYWSALFEARGFECAVNFRWRFWTDERIPFWYRQNMLCYIERKQRDLIERLRVEEGSWILNAKDLIHPDLYLRYCRDLERKSRRTEQLSELLGRKSEELNRLLSKKNEELAQIERELARTKEELSGIKNSRSWRLVQRLMPLVRVARRIKSSL